MSGGKILFWAILEKYRIFTVINTFSAKGFGLWETVAKL
jgi:hypothetical protein